MVPATSTLGVRGAVPKAAERLELVISERRVRGRVAQLGRAIEADYRGGELSLVVVLKGACLFAADLVRHIALPVAIGFVTAASYGNGAVSSGTVALGGIGDLDVRRRDVLVIEDILDTGRTCAAIVERLEGRGAASIGICALLRKPGAAALDLPVRYVGFEIPDDFVVGYGMDYAERHRNLRAVYRLIAGDS